MQPRDVKHLFESGAQDSRASLELIFFSKAKLMNISFADIIMKRENI